MKVAVIMSTYNGEKYIREQIDSILNQTDVEVELFIRDDGSKDTTVKIIEEYEQMYSNVHVDIGINLGFRQSFIQELLSARGYEYYSFSDQDDYWEKEKLYQACLKLQKVKNGRPAVYYSNLNVADANLNVYRTTKLQNRKKSLESLVMRRSIAGCTMVFNEHLWNKIAEVDVTDDMLKRGHDSFILSLCYALGGTVICDPNAYIRYRQHTSNTSGSSHGAIQRIKKEWGMLVKKRGTEPAIARSLLENWEKEMRPEEIKALQLIAQSESSIPTRLKIVASGKFTSGNLCLTVAGKMKALFGLL